MTPGTFRRDFRDRVLVCTCGPAGWTTSEPGLAAAFDQAYPVAGSPAGGVAWVAAFRRAAREWGGTVLTPPAADPAPPGLIH
jgi:hypothetical protein